MDDAVVVIQAPQRIRLRWGLGFLNDVVGSVRHLRHLHGSLVHFQGCDSLLRHRLRKTTPTTRLPAKCTNTEFTYIL